MTTGGAYVIAWSPDPTPNVGVGDLAAVAFACERSAMARFDQSVTFEVPPQTTFKWLQTEGSDDLVHHGSIMVVVLSPPVGVKGMVTVPVMLEWEVEWQGRKLLPLASEDTLIGPDPGYVSLFTTSDSGFDSTVLTFKVHSGGSMVPFHQSRPGVVYTTKGTSTKVPYVKADGTAGECEYVSRVVGYEVPGLVLHTSQTEAEEYQRTGDKQHCIVYKAAGGYVTPQRPEFKGLGAKPAKAVASEPCSEVETLKMQVQLLEEKLEGFMLGEGFTVLD